MEGFEGVGRLADVRQQQSLGKCQPGDLLHMKKTGQSSLDMGFVV